MPPGKGQGQWALGYREPLNVNERNKRDNDGLLVRQRIIDIYSKTGFAGIDPADLRGRFRWYGLYTQRRPGIAGGRTAVLEPEELEDEYFMLRIRIEDVPTIWDKLEAVGLSTTEACGDTPRVMLGCPLEGVAADSVLDASAALQATVEQYLGDPQFSNLPRKYKTTVTGCARHCTNHEINDVSFMGVVNDDGVAGFDVWVGGGLSTNPMFAQRLGVFVEPSEVSEVWAGITSVFRDYGYRRSRNHARLKFLIADWGPERFREVLEKEYLGRALPDGPEVPASPPHRDHVGVERQRDGRFAVGATTKAGRTSGSVLTALADLADRFGDGRIRTTPQQGLVLLGVSDVEPLVGELDALELSVRPSAFHRGTIACTGIEFCKLAIVETNARAEVIREELERRLPDFDTPITINVNGCPNSCARFQVADIGFKGIVTRGADGTDQEAFQVHLGGQMGAQAAFGRKFRGLKVLAGEAPDYAERILRGYLDRRAAGETFATYVARADEAWLL